EGIDKDQMCYPPVDQIRPGMVLSADFLRRKGYRLPTEAEWEYACRAGAATARFYGHADALLGRYAWTAANSGYRAAPVGQWLPNALGLFDVFGNAREFCHDRRRPYPDSPGVVRDDTPDPADEFEDEPRATRGGAFLYEPSTARSAHRDAGLPARRHPYQGFRVVRTVD